MITEKEVVRTFENKKIKYHKLSGPGGSLIIAPEKGARICSAAIDGENCFWINKDKVLANDWNFGGQRSWIAPETGKKGMFADETWSCWQCPPAIDPGNYVTESADSAKCTCRSRFSIQTNDKTVYELSLSRSVQVADIQKKLPSGVGSLAIHFSHSLTNEGTSLIDKEIGLWSLIMLPNEKAGTVIVPLTKSTGKCYRDNYFGRVPEDRINIADNLICMQVHGGIIYKIGVPPEASTGCIASIRPSRIDNSLIMVIKKFSISSKGVYVDRPLKEQHTNGDAIQSYNSEGSGADCFFEIECHAPAEKLAPGKTQTHEIAISIYKGPAKDIFAVAASEISINFNPAKAFLIQE